MNVFSVLAVHIEKNYNWVKCLAYTKNGFNSCGFSSRRSSAIFSEHAKFGNQIIQIIRIGRIN